MLFGKDKNNENRIWAHLRPYVVIYGNLTNSGPRTNKGISKFGCESTAKNRIKASASFFGGGDARVDEFHPLSSTNISGDRALNVGVSAKTRRI